MELDPRLQNLSSADLQDFTVPHYPNFDQGYQSALYDNGLNDDHSAAGHPQTHPHPQAYAQYVPNQNEATHFDGSGTSPVRSRSNHNALARGRNVASQNINRTPINPRGNRHIPPHPPPTQQQQYNNLHFASPTTTIPNTNKSNRIQHASPSHSTSSSPLTQRAPSRSQLQQQPQPSPQQQQHQQLQQQQHPSQPPQGHSRVHLKPQQQLQPQQQVVQQQPQLPPGLPTVKTTTTATPTAATTNNSNSLDPAQFTHPSTFPLVPSPPNLHHWREKFFDITEPLYLTSEEYHTYFPHVDNIYSHRSTQKYKKKPFVSHYWDCRLKGRPTGTPLSKLRARKEGRLEEEEDTAPVPASAGGDADKEIKKRKRKTRERDLCDVKIKVTEYFGRDELEAMGKLGINDQSGGMGDGDDSLMENAGSSGGLSDRAGPNGQLTFVLEDGTSTSIPSSSGAGHRMSVGGVQNGAAGGSDDAMSFGILEPLKKLPKGHPGAEGKRWYMVQRVNGSGKEDDDASLDHKHTMEESDRIKKNSVQRWLLAQEKERKKQNRNKSTTDADGSSTARSTSVTSAPSFHASGKAQQTAKSRATPAATGLTFYANSFCPFAQRIWIALELKGIPYQYVEVMPSHMKEGKCTIPGLLEVCPDGVVPCLRHGTWAIWESDVVLEYLEDLSIGHSLLPLGEPQLRAHSRLWKDHINRKILPYFYALLLLPGTDLGQANGQLDQPTTAEKQSLLITTLQEFITQLVNASHAAGPYFLGAEMSFVDVAFAPWIIRLSRVLEYYKEFPKPEVGTRWKTWVDAVESNDAVRRTVSDEKSYHAVYGGMAKDGSVPDKGLSPRAMAEIRSAQRLVRQAGFGLGGDVWGTLLPSEQPGGLQRPG